jgi:4-hydroxybenzoate polyprenyltransferase
MSAENVRALAELVRLPAVLSVPGDVLAGAALSGAPRPPGRVAGLCAASAGLYLGGMALNDWADREVDAVERPGRPIPSGRVAPATALAVAVGLTGAGLVAARLAGGRRSLATASATAAAAWGYDLLAKSTPAGPPTMAAARALDVLLGGDRRALPGAAVVALHTAVTTVLSGHEVGGATARAPERALAGTALVTAAAAALAARRSRGPLRMAAALGLLAAYAAQVGGAQDAARRSPDPAAIQAAVGAGVVGLALLEAALLAACGAAGQAAAVTGLYLVAKTRRRAVT